MHNNGALAATRSIRSVGTVVLAPPPTLASRPGQADDKSFLDSTLPAGTTTATYTVHGVRGNLAGLPSDPVTFFLGNADAGEIAMAA